MNLNARAAARLLCVPEAQIYAWVDEGVLPSSRVHDQLRFNRVELLEWAAARRLKVAPELFEEEQRDRRPAPGGSFRLSKALAQGGIHRDIAARDEASALRALASCLPLPAGIDRDAVIELFASRAGVASVGGGVAIPHARAPVVLPIPNPIVALGLLAQPIDVRAPDGKPVGALFVVFTPTIRVHLDVLSKIAFALATPAFHELLTRRAPSEQIIEMLASLESGASGEAVVGEESGSL